MTHVQAALLWCWNTSFKHDHFQARSGATRTIPFYTISKQIYRQLRLEIAYNDILRKRESSRLCIQIWLSYYSEWAAAAPSAAASSVDHVDKLKNYTSQSLYSFFQLSPHSFKIPRTYGAVSKIAVFCLCHPLALLFSVIFPLMSCKLRSQTLLITALCHRWQL